MNAEMEAIVLGYLTDAWHMQTDDKTATELLKVSWGVFDGI